jgi:hypothetical protein
MANTFETHQITDIISAVYDEGSHRVTLVVATNQELHNPIQYVRLSPLHFRLLEVPVALEPASEKAKKPGKVAASEEKE